MRNSGGIITGQVLRPWRMSRRRGEYACWILRWRFVALDRLKSFKSLIGTLADTRRAVQGVKQVKRTNLNARFLFLSPPSVEILEKRLKGRGTDSEDAIQKRLKQAEAEMTFAKEEGVHDKIVVNGELDRAYKEVEEWIVDGGRYGG